MKHLRWWRYKLGVVLLMPWLFGEHKRATDRLAKADPGPDYWSGHWEGYRLALGRLYLGDAYRDRERLQ